MKRVATISIGDELLAGDGLDSNAQRLAKAIFDRGWVHGGHETVHDDVDCIVEAFTRAGRDNDLVLSTGGLGPTLDDLTREAIGVLVGEALVEDPDLVRVISGLFESRGISMPSTNLRQAMRPSSATAIENRNGTAPGLRVLCDGFELISLPGPPREMTPMLAEVLSPVEVLAPRAEVLACGLGESAAAEKIDEWMGRDAEPLVGITFSDTLIRAKIRARNVSTTKENVAAIEASIRAAWAPWVIEGSTLQESVAQVFLQTGDTLAIAESCTGGMIQSMLTEEAGASAWFRGGFVTYSNDMKRDHLGVEEELLARDGAVSRSVACAMAAGAAKRSNATIGLSTTGIAGPDGGSELKPRGTVFIGVADENGAEARHFLFPGDRAAVRRRTAQAALQLLRFRVLGIQARLLFEVVAK